MKTFQEFFAEQTSNDHHSEALSLLRKHAQGASSEAMELEPGDGKGHLGAIPAGKAHEAFVGSLKAAGFHHQGTGYPPMGANSGDRAAYHHYSKGGTSVFIASKPNTYRHSEKDPENTHHHVEIATPKL
jgi:hypothetical protein